ncbi:MAG TPA: CBS domain-containing protein, partial [bacterium]|nr:CBS domain-containing protein [bacterium]
QNTIEKIARAERIPRLYQHDNLDIAIKIFYSFQTTVLPVLDNPQDNNVVGIITQNDIIKFYANISNEKKVNRLSETIDYLKIKYKKNN